MLPDWAQQIIETYGPGTLVTIIVVFGAWVLVKAFAGQMNADTKKDETVTGFAVKFDSERAQLQQRYDQLNERFTQFQIEQAKKDGSLETLEKMLKQERDDRREESLSNNIKYGKLEMRVEELEKRNQQGLDRIKELELERDSLNRNVVEKTAAINLLEESVRDITTKLEQETNRANALSSLVERLQSIPSTTMNATQPLPTMDEVEADETFIPELPSAVATAEDTQP